MLLYNVTFQECDRSSFILAMIARIGLKMGGHGALGEAIFVGDIFKPILAIIASTKLDLSHS